MARAQNSFPEGNELTAQIHSRHRRGNIWRVLFQIATVVGIVALALLLYNIVNSSFGYTAVQNAIEPAALTLAYDEDQLLRLANTVSSEDDNQLAAEIMADPYAIGFFGYAYYQENEATLRALAVDGVQPGAAAVEDGSYPLARPLYIYTAESVLAEKPEVAAFVDFYLSHVDESIDEIGYFAAAPATLAAAENAFLAAAGQTALAGPVAESGSIAIAGSSTVYPLTQALADGFVAAGYGGQIEVASIGSTAGLNQLCVDEDIDIANASRPINEAEFEACRRNGRDPLELRIGTDALAVVVSQENSFVNELTQAQLLAI
ncbi:MAG: substrate-binding domain-containing protein, partial [Anaerolineales bacterium]|nr:substrate-binding domain-containing protein [Anaerolineales bacterium]